MYFPRGSGLEYRSSLLLAIACCKGWLNWVGPSEWDKKTRSPMTQQLWHDKETSALIGCRGRECLNFAVLHRQYNQGFTGNIFMQGFTGNIFSPSPTILSGLHRQYIYSFTGNIFMQGFTGNIFSPSPAIYSVLHRQYIQSFTGNIFRGWASNNREKWTITTKSLPSSNTLLFVFFLKKSVVADDIVHVMLCLTKSRILFLKDVYSICDVTCNLMANVRVLEGVT